jgi:FtsH-binding integral membrane protein
MTAVRQIEAAGPVRRGLLVWFAVLGGIPSWAVHILIVAGMARYTCNIHDGTWILHLATAVTAAVTIVALALAANLVRIAHRAGARDPEDEADSADARLLFLGTLGLLLNGINLLLILLEGAYVPFLSRCGT